MRLALRPTPLPCACGPAPTRRSCGRGRSDVRPRCGETDPRRLAGHRPRPAHAADRLGDGQPGLQAVLVEAGAEVGAAEPGATPALQRPELALRTEGVRI